MNISQLPLLNASLNGLSACLIVLGLWLIHRGRQKAHVVCMILALLTSALFLGSYLTYHYLSKGLVTRFTESGWPKAVYYFILFTHIPLAALTLPLVAMTVIPAVRHRYDRHRRMAKWTVPVWLYVSVTGVLVYMMLYVWFPPVAAH
jgi:putative membrane protein